MSVDGAQQNGKIISFLCALCELCERLLNPVPNIMCGICGIYNLNGQPVDKNLLKKMNSTMVHRGPDDEGYYLKGNVGLGHRRLSIIDLNTGHQPIYNEDKTKVIVFNGEVYNFLELKHLLESKGHQFQTETDTEVISHAYEEWGVECVNRLRGMFAFAIWDEKEKKLFLARDRLGIKPLYYYCDESRLIFASEIKAILEVKDVSKDIDLEALSDYFSYGYVPEPKSIFRSIRKLPPGHFIIYSKQGITMRQYWDLKFDPAESVSEDFFCDRILQILDESVQMRLVSDVPFGAFLSGGIDSSLVVAIMSGLVTEAVVTNSVGFIKREFSELEYAQTTSKLFGTNHHEYVVNPDAVEIVNKLSWHFDEPFADSSSIPTYYVSKMTKQNVTVALSGDGGDENFAGYRRHFYDRLENQLRKAIPNRFRHNIISTLARVYPKADWLPQIFRAKTLLTNISHDPVFAYFNTMSYFSPDMKEKILGLDIKKDLNGYNSIEVFRNHYNRCNSQDPLTRTQYVDFKTYLVGDILTKVDRSSMANSLEVRVPLLDHKFVELVASIPSALKLKGKTSKYIFKKTASRILPNTILTRKKMGFSIPVGHWMKNELKPLVYESLLGKECKERSLFNDKYIKWIWKQHLSGLRDFTRPLWCLLSFELWAKKFYKG